jgi:hypothetical protein
MVRSTVPFLYSYCVRLSETNPARKLGIRLTTPNPIQPRNSTVQWFLLYAVKLSMLPFAMHSAPIPAGVASGASRASLVSRAPQLPITASVPTRVLDRFVNPFFSYCYELPFPQLLCFDNYLRCPLVFGNTPYPQLSVLCAGACPDRVGAFRNILTPLLTHSCGLLIVAKNINSFAIKQIQALLAKNTQGGVPLEYRSANFPAFPAESAQRNVDAARTSNYHCCKL